MPFVPFVLFVANFTLILFRIEVNSSSIVVLLYSTVQNPENFASPIEVSERSDVFRKADVRRR